MTLDGTSYIFNPVGEFVYLTTGNGVVKTRITQYADSQGIKKLACYFSAFAVKSGDADTVQVDLSSVGQFAFRVNGQSVTLDQGLWPFNGVSLDYIKNTTVVVQTASSISIEIQIISEVLSAIVSLPSFAKGQVKGLLGNWDDDVDHDLELPDGTHIPIDSTPANIHHKFGMAWSTYANNSLFTYPTGLSWSDYQNPNFVPSFSTTPPENPGCNGDRDCNYDVSITGDLNVGLSNIAVKQRAAEVQRVNNEIATYSPASVGVANGKVSVDGSGSSVNYSVTCNKGFKLEGSKKVTCINGKYDAIGICASAYKTAPFSSTMIAIVLAAIMLRRLMTFS